MASGGVIAQAYVELLPKLDKFNQQLSSNINSSLGKVDDRVNKTGTNVGSSFKRGTDSVKATLGQVEQSVARTGATTSRSFKDAGDKAAGSFKGASTAVHRVERDAAASTNKIKGYFSSVGSEINASFGKVAAGAVIGGALFQFFKGSFNAASDLNETISKTRTVFGPASEAVEEFASTSARALGQSRQQALEAASTFGNLFAGLKVAPQLAASMSIQLDKLASDFASFHNADPAEVIEAITAAFRGEYDSVQRFVPTLQAATVQQEALRQTGLKSVSQLNSQQLALATYSLLTKGAGAATGDFARTAGGAANQQRILRAEFENLQARIGSAVIPVMIALFHALSSVIQMGNSLIDSLSGVGEIIGSVFEGLTSTLSDLGVHKSTILGIAAAVASFIAISKGVSIIRSLIMGVVTGFQMLYLKALYAADGVRTLGSGMNVAKAAGFGLNAIIGIAAIGIGIWAQKHAEAKARADELKQAIISDSNAFGQNTREVVSNRLAQDGLLSAANKLGISLPLVTDAALGNQRSLSMIRAELLQYNPLAASSGRITQEQAAAAQVLLQGLDSLPPEVRKAAEAAKLQSEASKEAKGSTEVHGTAMQTAAQKATEEKQKLDELRDALYRVANVNLDAIQTHLQFQAAIITLDSSLKGLNATQAAQTLSLNANTAAGNEARQTLVSNVKAALADYNAQLQRGVGVSRATATLQNDIKTLRDHYTRLGYNKQAVDSIIGSLTALAKQHPAPTVTVNNKASGTIAAIKRDLDRLRDKRLTLTGRYVTDLSQWHPPANAPALAGLQASGGYIDGPGKKGIDSLLIGAAPGEFMINARAVSKPGVRQFLERLNRSNDFTGSLRTIGADPTGNLGALVNTQSAQGVGVAASGGTSIVISPGAVQINVDGSWDSHSRSEIEEIVERAFTDLLHKIQVGGARR